MPMSYQYRDTLLSQTEYPGDSIRGPIVIAPETEEGFLRIETKPGEGLGNSPVWISGKRSDSLDSFLGRQGQPLMGDRYPVVGIGSNSNLDVLASKFTRHNRKSSEKVSLVVPIFIAEVDRRVLEVGLMPELSSMNYFPYTPFVPESKVEALPGVLTVTVAFFSREQLAVVDATEGYKTPTLVSVSGASCTYHRVKLLAKHFPIRLNHDGLLGESGSLESSPGAHEILDYCFIYWSATGYVASKSTSKAELAKVIVASESRDRLTTLLPGELALENQETGFSAINRASLSAHVLQPAGHEACGVDATPKDTYRTEEALAYESIGKTFRSSRLPVLWTCVPTHTGEIVARTMPIIRTFSPDQAKSRFVWVVHPIWGSTEKSIRALAEAHPVSRTRETGANTTVRTIQVDQTLREAIKVEQHGLISIEPAAGVQGSLSDILLGSRMFQTLRTQISDLSNTETRVCVLDRSTLELMGLKSGATVVLYGPGKTSNHEKRKAKKVRVRVIGSDEQIARRRSIIAENTKAETPAAGPEPEDIPWILIDGELQTFLGVDPSQPISARPSRVSLGLGFSLEIVSAMVIGSLAFATADAKEWAFPILVASAILSLCIVRARIITTTGSFDPVLLGTTKLLGFASRKLRNRHQFFSGLKEKRIPPGF
jgi:hypothetical protein